MWRSWQAAQDRDAKDQWKVGTSAKARAVEKEVKKGFGGTHRDWGRLVVAALIITNALFVFWRKTEAEREEKSAPSFSTWSEKKSFRLANNELEAVLLDDYERLPVKIHRRHPFKGHGLQSFVLLSGYRTGPSTFAALGLAAAALRSSRDVTVCRWQGNDGKAVNGTVTLNYPGDAHGLRYETLILSCKLDSNVGAHLGGQLQMDIDKTQVVVYTEREDKHRDIGGPFRHNITHCSPPIYEPRDAERLRQWMEFHRLVHGVDSFIFYDAGGIDGDMREVLDPFVKRGILEVSNVRQTAMYDTWQHAQVLLANDCLYRTKFSSQWALFLDFDEYLSFPHSRAAASLPVYLSGHAEHPWISFGSIFYSITHCSVPYTASDPRWAVERLIFHEAEVHCKNVGRFRNRHVCLEWAGHRKYIAKPREVDAVQIYRVVNSTEGGLDAPANEMRLNHFRGLADKTENVCRFVWENGASPPRLVLDPSVAELAASARKTHGLVWFAD